MASELFKVLNFLNAVTSDSQMGEALDNKIKDMIKSLSPSEKKQAKDALKEKKQGMRYGGMASKVYVKGSGTRKINNQEKTVTKKVYANDAQASRYQKPRKAQSEFSEGIKTMAKTGAATVLTGLGLMGIGLGRDAVTDMKKRKEKEKLKKRYSPRKKIDTDKVRKIDPYS